MNRKRSTPIIIIIIPLVAGGVFGGQSSSTSGRRLGNPYLTMTVVSGWAVRPSSDQTLNLIRGKYLLSINPIFTHASGVIGGRFGEIVGGMPSVKAVAGDVAQPPGAIECAQWPGEQMTVTSTTSLRNLYTDSSKVGNGCVFPSTGRPVWFCSYFSGKASEGEYSITLAYRTADVNSLPRKGSAELTRVLGEAVTMLKTLHLKPPIVVSRVYPRSAPPGATVTIYGRGFRLPRFSEVVSFREFPNNSMPAPVIATDGRSLTFEVPTSIGTISCQAGYVDVGENCLPVPANHVNFNDCPRNSDGSTNFCGKPTPPATYHISVEAGSCVSSNTALFTVTTPKSSPVSISLIYPNSLVSPGDTITVRGSGFTANGDTVRIGSAVVSDLFSPDGKTIRFKAPAPRGNSFLPGSRIYEASVSNANGQSNSISFDYR